MFPLMHIFIPLLFIDVFGIPKKEKIERFWLIVGSMLPDLIDKPITLLTDLSGRGLGHTPLYLLAISICSFVVFRKKNKSQSLTLGWVFHLILDIPAVPWFAPFINYDFGYLENPLEGWWWSLTHNPKVYISEILSAIGLFIIAFKNHFFFNWRNIKEYLFASEVEIKNSKKTLNKLSIESIK